MRLIDADKLRTIRSIQSGDFNSIETIQKWIGDAPTVDAEPVIRCCDCVHFEYFENQFVQMTRCDVHDRCPDYTDYCSWGERRDENADDPD